MKKYGQILSLHVYGPKWHTHKLKGSLCYLTQKETCALLAAAAPPIVRLPLPLLPQLIDATQTVSVASVNGVTGPTCGCADGSHPLRFLSLSCPRSTSLVGISGSGAALHDGSRWCCL